MTIQILHQIHLHVQNPNLALVSKTLNAYLSPPYVTSYYTATYLLKFHSGPEDDLILSQALTHPVCTVKVAGDIKRIWDKRRGYIEPPTPPLPERSTDDTGEEAAETTPAESPHRPPPTRPGLSITDLPRRLFRNLSTRTPIPPLLTYLFDTYSPSPNSHTGYPLLRAVLAKNVEVIKYLLSKGADPGMRDGLAIEIAVKLGDLGIVKMLVEHQSQALERPAGEHGEVGISGQGIQALNMEIPSKWVETAVKSGSDEIVSYFVHEKGQSNHRLFGSLALTK